MCWFGKLKEATEKLIDRLNTTNRRIIWTLVKSGGCKVRYHVFSTSLATHIFRINFNCIFCECNLIGYLHCLLFSLFPNWLIKARVNCLIQSFSEDSEASVCFAFSFNWFNECTSYNVPDQLQQRRFSRSQSGTKPIWRARFFPRFANGHVFRILIGLLRNLPPQWMPLGLFWFQSTIRQKHLGVGWAVKRE